MKKNNILLGIEGILLILLGLLAIIFPQTTAVMTMLFIGWLFFIVGIAMFIYAVRLPADHYQKTAYILESILLFIIGILFIFGDPYITTLTMIYALIAWFIITAIFGIIFSSKWLTGGIKIAAYVLNAIIIIVAVLALSDQMLAGAIFILTLAYNFMFAGVSRLLLIDLNK